MKNTLGDLNNHLFAQLERLSDEDLKGESLKEEMDRAKSVTQVACQIVNNASLVLKAKEMAYNSINADAKVPKMLEG